MHTPDFFPDEEHPPIEERVGDAPTEGGPCAEAHTLSQDNPTPSHYPTGAGAETGDSPHQVGSGIDITARKLSEAERLSPERQIQLAQKLENLGGFARGITHDFNNIIMAIMNNADLALGKLSKLSPAYTNITEIVKASRWATDLAQQILAYSGKDRPMVEQIDCNVLVEEMMPLLDVSISKKIRREFRFDENLPTLKGDPSQIRQIVMNLILNAAEAIGDKSGTISLSTGTMDCDQGHLESTNSAFIASMDEPLPTGKYIYFEVTDTGNGMDDETINNIFDPFYTSKPTGNGVGLSVVLGIVRDHKGTIKVNSETGKGTTFRVLFPANYLAECSLSSK